MKILVTDACIFISLYELNLIDQFFELDFEIHTTSDIISELHPYQKEPLRPFIKKKRLTIYTLSTADKIVNAKVSIPKKLSIQDRSIYLYAQKTPSILVTSDSHLRKQAENNAIECHGLLWIIDHIRSQQLIASEDIKLKLKLLLEDPFYGKKKWLKDEIQKRINKS